VGSDPTHSLEGVISHNIAYATKIGLEGQERFCQAARTTPPEWEDRAVWDGPRRSIRPGIGVDQPAPSHIAGPRGHGL